MENSAARAASLDEAALSLDNPFEYILEKMEKQRRKPFLKETLHYFTPSERISKGQLENISFNSQLSIFDTKYIKEGVSKELSKALKGVEQIDSLRINLQLYELCDAIHNDVWKNLKELEIMSYGVIPRSRHQLFSVEKKEFRELKKLIIADADLFFKLNLPSSMEIISFTYDVRLDGVDFIRRLKETNRFEDTYISYFGKQFQLKDIKQWNDIRYCKQLEDIPYQDDPMNISPYCTLLRGSKMLINDQNILLQKQRYGYQSFFKERGRVDQLSNVKIAILDSGISFNHPHLEPSIEGGRSFVPNQHWFFDPHGHGTKCAGIIAGSKTGIAKGVKLYIGKILDDNGQGNLDQIAQGIEWATEQGVHIISLSVGGQKYHQRLWEKIHQALGKGIIIVCSAGNYGNYGMMFPATMDGVIRVGSVDIYGRSSNFSSIGGPQIDAATLGEDVITTCSTGLTVVAGTSLSAPFISAVCAYLLAFDMFIHQSTVPKQLLNSHCIKCILGRLCFNNTQEIAKGRGIVDLERIFNIPGMFKYELDQIC